ncbi:co-regulatory protein PtrA N-terminal domain-containing protein [Pseudomonas sp. RTC3]|uniref:co-regulatory protein PtrA N-terminal domain-containing protein n=1 Tax=unclassified Pseudomonas TaxID=196821 RepID=UPI002AB4248E|nr:MULTISPECIES: co-regulatory protein PtrA N-terminal domain-containing protein [unclassified Pseudomonas]MEB0064845.1 co-regulatory protein PtrA N-terminal domain-containing protein [Pseudomonas sp. RTC3]MDY7564751.1 co-regulatory protein PtrA N-terminal domain-containing protein [Pseudomonas sp. 5C2]MEB0008371.1 co-regulatory protein PtrA N-terminal domain-containing protein [Pseudomonas sp. RTB2]MEB0018038.1 co-regulatory protein PtrA N-terminal domain-containing protein [Pseudomonas sp. RT
MKTLKALLIVSLMSASVAALAEGGGDRVVARMDAAREVSMKHYQQAEHKEAVVIVQKAISHDVERLN